MSTGAGRSSGDTRIASASTRLFPIHEEIALAINAFIMADKAAQEGSQSAHKEKMQHLRTIQSRYWRVFYSVLSANLVRNRQGLDFSDDERLYMDLGLVDPQMLGENRSETQSKALEEIGAKGMPGCYYLTEWFVHRQQQLQLETSLAGVDKPEDSYASQLRETRRRILSRLSEYFTGLPGIPLEVSDSMRSGDLDNAVIAVGISTLQEPRRRNLLRRRSLWQLREQVLAKARARANNPTAIRLFELLNELYARDWRGRYNAHATKTATPLETIGSHQEGNSNLVSNPNHDLIMSEARQTRMRIALMAAVDGSRPDPVLYTNGPRMNKKGLAEFLRLAQVFDRALMELPPVIIVPGSGRGFFAWETGCVFAALRPLVSVEDSLATAFAWQRMLDDRLSHGGALRQAYERKFPGAVFHNDFPVDYRAWFTRLTKGEIGAMPAERRGFFRDHIGPDIRGPILPSNLRNIGPQTMVTICRRLENQLASGNKDVNLHRRLATLYWQQGNAEAAKIQFTIAMQAAPENGETLFTAGMFMRSQDDNNASNDCFRFGAERARNSLWGIYCQDALDNLI